MDPEPTTSPLQVMYSGCNTICTNVLIRHMLLTGFSMVFIAIVNILHLKAIPSGNGSSALITIACLCTITIVYSFCCALYFLLFVPYWDRRRPYGLIHISRCTFIVISFAFMLGWSILYLDVSYTSLINNSMIAYASISIICSGCLALFHMYTFRQRTITDAIII